jgi:hypothetical protein
MSTLCTHERKAFAHQVYTLTLYNLMCKIGQEVFTWNLFHELLVMPSELYMFLNPTTAGQLFVLGSCVAIN